MRRHRHHTLLPIGYGVSWCYDCHRHFFVIIDGGKLKITPAVCACGPCKAAAE